MSNKPSGRDAEPTPDTPGRPTEQGGSRQQTHKDQGVQSGSPELDSKPGAKIPDIKPRH